VIDREPLTELIVGKEGGRSMPWTKARRWLSETEYYWLATVNPKGGPHVVPVLAVWMEGAMYFCANPTPEKPAIWITKDAVS
jgi:nitroimidazol reductase NimA-like FMN-containing flavoprotein (pyridoxamine 5'-phosphate oxidase superfamily)